MRSTLRLLGLTLVLLIAVFSAAEGFPGACYVECPNGGIYVITPTYGCCGPISPLDFTCPGGGQASGFAYEDWSGPQFCT